MSSRRIMTASALIAVSLLAPAGAADAAQHDILARTTAEGNIVKVVARNGSNSPIDCVAFAVPKGKAFGDVNDIFAQQTDVAPEAYATLVSSALPNGTYRVAWACTNDGYVTASNTELWTPIPENEYGQEFPSYAKYQVTGNIVEVTLPSAPPKPCRGSLC